MAEIRPRALRLALGLSIVILAVVNVQGLLQTLRSQARVRDRVAKTATAAIAAARPRLAPLLHPGGEAAFRAVAEDAAKASLASEIEIFDASGRPLLSRSSQAPVTHWPPAADIPGIIQGRIQTYGPVPGRAPRLLTYAGLQAGSMIVVVRFAVPAPELVDDLRERRELLLGHAASLAILVVAGVLALYPRASAAAEPHTLDAYEEAMGRLRDRGDLLAQQIRESAPMVRAGELTAGMAHEVRNGLGTIVGHARLVERGLPPAEAMESAKAIREECEALETVVRRFVEFVKEESLHVARFDIARMLGRVGAREERQRPGAAVEVAPAEGVFLEGDEEMLERAFENLVRNAREAAGDGGHVRVAASPDGDGVRVVVSDDGPGLPQAAREALRPFVTTKPGGLGLGLPIVYKIVGLHRGEIRMGDVAPRGLAVTVFLPGPGLLQGVAGEGPGERVAPGEDSGSSS